MEGEGEREKEGPGHWREEKMMCKENQSFQLWHVERRNQTIKMESGDLRFNQLDARWTWLLKNEAIFTEVHLTELTCKSQGIITFVYNHKIRCQGDL